MKMNGNQGFSLVELIIVITIMAVLIGVLAPQYVKYVEKSRVAADEDNANALENVACIMISDADVVSKIAIGDYIEFKNDGVHPSTDDLENILDYYFDDWQSKKVKSKTHYSQSFIVKFIQSDTDNVFQVQTGWQ